MSKPGGGPPGMDAWYKLSFEEELDKWIALFAKIKTPWLAALYKFLCRVKENS